ncbi:hypothetical protein D3C75_1030260 [compost metagenome]
MLGRLPLPMLQQIDSQHFTVAQRGRQGADRRRGRLQLLNPGQAPQGSQQAAQTANRDAQVMQRFGVGARTQPGLTGQQTHLQPQDPGH